MMDDDAIRGGGGLTATAGGEGGGRGDAERGPTENDANRPKETKRVVAEGAPRGEEASEGEARAARRERRRGGGRRRRRGDEVFREGVARRRAHHRHARRSVREAVRLAPVRARPDGPAVQGGPRRGGRRGGEGAAQGEGERRRRREDAEGGGGDGEEATGGGRGERVRGLKRDAEMAAMVAGLKRKSAKKKA